MSKYQKEIESLLSRSESSISKDLKKLYKDLANEITQEIIALAEQIEKDDKFSKKLQKERLESIRSQMYAKANQLEGDQQTSMFDFLAHDASTAYNELFYEFEMSEKIPLSFAMLTEKQIATIINTPVAGRKLSTRLKGNSSKMKKNLNRVLTRGFSKGWSTQKMAAQIAEIGGANYRRAMNIARTESGRVTSVTRQQSQQHAKDLGIKAEKKWVSTLDGDTRNNHRKLDGQIRAIDEYFEVGGLKALQPHMFGIASEDCNCRCRTVNVIKGYSPKLRRDNEAGKVIEYTNYTEWLNNKKGVQEQSIKYTNSLDKTNMKSKIGEKNYSNFIKHLDSIENGHVLRMINALGKNVEFFDMKNTRAFARGHVVQLSQQSFDGNETKNYMQTVYHELGHAFDSLGLELLTGKKYMPTGRKVKKTILRKKREVDELIYHASGIPEYNLKSTINRDLWTFINGDLPMYEDLGPKPRKKAEKAIWEKESSKIYEKSSTNLSKFQQKYRKLAKENPKAYSALSDMMESTGFFFGSYPLGGGHGSSYWKDAGSAETEFFAHMTELVANKDSEKIMREIFPNASKKWEKIVNDILRKVK